MKKLTAGIFATILGLTTVNAFAATQDGVASTGYVRGAMAAAETAAKAYTDTKVSGVNTALDGYMKVDTFNTFKTENTAAIESAASAAQTAAINTAASDATTKAGQALTDAKAYTNTMVGTLPADAADVVTYVNTKTSGIATEKDLTTLQATVAGHTNSISNINTALEGKQATITGAQLNALNSGITQELVTTYNGYATTIAGAVSDASDAKADAAQAKSDASTAKTNAASAVDQAESAVEAAAAAAGVAQAASTQADSALTKANSAVETADTAKAAADKATADVTTLTTTVNGKLDTTTAAATYATKESVSDLAGDVGENATAISNLQTASATHATKSEVEAVDAKFANYVLVSSIVDEYKPAAN